MGEIITITKLLLFHLIPSMVTFAFMLTSPFSSPTISPTVTPVIIFLPIEGARLAYVQRQLINSGFQETEVNELLGDNRRELYPLKRVAYKEPNWTPIRRKLYSAVYVREGKNFITANQEAFDNAQQEFGVPGEIITGIIATETEFGRNTGSTPTFNAIYSRLQQWPEETWEGEAKRLVALSKYCLQSRLDCYDIKGSYAGAIGIVQFMPDSLLRYGIDGDENGIIDLNKSVDAIPSAANFLKNHGWAEDQFKALTRYYGRSVGYPEIVLTYASLLAK